MNDNNSNRDLANTGKRKRLSTACTRCRSRKLRCDDRLPACTPCHKAGAECITRDPRQPHVEVQRREAQSQARSPVTSLVSQDSPQDATVNAGTHLTASSNEAAPETGPARPRYYHEATTTGLFSGPLPAIPRFMSGNCLFMLTQWLDLAFARIGLPERFSWLYRPERVRLADHSLGDGHYKIDTRSWTRENQLDFGTFLSNVNLVFPLVDPDDTIQTPATQPEPTTTENSRVTAGSILQQLVLAAGSIVVAKDGKIDTGSRILGFAFSNLTTLVQDDSIHSVKALILMALLFRSHDDTEMAWRMLAITVPKAQALALDRRYPVHHRSQGARAIHRQQANTWWSLFILDKVLALELQRPPMVRECFYDQELLADPDETREAQTKKACFDAIANLARIQGQICERLLVCTQEEESGKLTLEQAIRAKMQAGGELDQLFLNWVKLLPDELKPSEYPSCDPVVLPAVAFLAIQYYQTLFLIHRNSLIINPQAVMAEIEAYFANVSYRLRLQNSAAICINAARSIVNVLNHILEVNTSFPLHSLYAPLISVYALAIHIMKNPGAGNAKTDLEIMASAARVIQRYESRRPDDSSTISTMVNTLYSQVSSRVNEFFRSSSIVSSGDRAQHATVLGVSAENYRQRPADSSTLLETVPIKLVAGFADKGSDQDSFGQMNEVFANENVSWPGTMAEVDFFNAELEATKLDWNAIAFTLDLPCI